MNKFHLIINTLPLIGTKTGIGRYLYEITKRIKDETIYDKTFFCGFYSKKLINSEENESKLSYLKEVIAEFSFLKTFVRNLLFKFSSLSFNKFDLYWEANFIPIKNIKSKKTVTSVHDFSFILHKEFHPKERVKYFENFFYTNILRSNKIICFSFFTKQEILSMLDFTEEDVHVIYHGIEHNLFKIQNNLNVDFYLPKKFIFSVGSIEPRKNLLGLLEAYDLLEDNFKMEYKLVLAGFKGWENKEIMTLIEKNKENIHYLGFISDIELVKVYNLATCFVFPSFYEGFGLPVLESMACGTPVICSNTSSLPEVGGDVVVYCNPYDVYDIKNKIEIVLNDENLQKEMIKNGLERAKLFSWEKSAEEHMKVFEEVLKN